MSRAEITNQADIQFGISNMSLPYPVMFGASVAGTDRYLEQIDADGLEVTPMHVSRFLERALRYGEQSRVMGSSHLYGRGHLAELYGFDLSHDWSDEAEVFERRLLSAHVSFRQETDDNGLKARFFPKWPESLHQLKRLQVAAGRRLPLVTYPHYADFDRPDYFDHTEPFKSVSFQPLPDQWLGSWGMPEDVPADQVRREMAVRGLNGITWDVFHSQRPGRHEDGIYQFRDPLELAQRMSRAGLVRAVHLALGRLDMVGADTLEGKRTTEARRLFVQSAASASRTLEGEMLVEIAKSWREVPEYAGAGPLITLEDLPQLSVRRAKRDQAAMLAHARELVAAA